MLRKEAWTKVWPLDKRRLKILDDQGRVTLSPELEKFVELEWIPKAKAGWKSSWIAFASNVKFSKEEVEVSTGAMPFHYIDGMLKAIEAGKSFAPQQGFVNCLSAGFVTATEDAKVIFQRRAPDVHCPNILIHEPCGYMASMNFAPRSER